ncbi:hypothetical protein [Embleya sp. NPDC050493]|uniref:hypothetical protein n=1 Tax=Embleya sp. NPDC050493 TaxID=3363989 RepID=UPI0037BD06C3
MSAVPLRGKLAALVAVAAFVATGCGSSGADEKAKEGTTGKEPPLGELRRIRGPADVALPLDAYWPTTQDRANSFRAVYLVGADCMRRFGSPDWPVPDMGPQAPTEGRNMRRYGVFLASDAERYGYHSPDQAAGQSAPPPPRTTRVPTPLENQIWAGQIGQTPDGRKVPTGGCSQESEDKIINGVPRAEFLNTVQNLMMESWTKVKTDSRAQAATAKWSECMARSGYKYGDIWAAHDGNSGGPTATSKEIAVAEVDVACRQETNLTNLLFTIDAAYQNQSIEAHAEVLRKVKDYQDALKRGAARVLAGKPVAS